MTDAELAAPPARLEWRVAKVIGTRDETPNTRTLVLDVPVEAKNIWIGTSLIGKGQIWVDDFKLEVVDNSVASTNSFSTEMMNEVHRNLAKTSKETNKHPVNLGFEGGAVH